MKRIVEELLTQRFQLLNLMLGLLCFIVLPGLIILRGIDGIIELESAERRQKAERKLQDQLDQLELFSENDRFAHFVLRSLCTRVEKSKAASEQLRDGITSLKKSFPNAFTFIVADQNGSLIPGLSDENEFQYLYRQAFTFFKEVGAAFAEGKGPESLAGFDLRFTRIKPLLGNFLKTDHLIQPFRTIRSGKSILASGSPGRYHLWYGSANEFQLIVFVSRSFIMSDNGLRWAAELLNRKNPDVLIGFTEYPPDKTSLFPPLSEELAARAILAIAGHEQMNLSPQESHKAGQNFACRFLNQKWRGFALYRGLDMTDSTTINAVVTATLLKYLFVLFFVMFVYQLKHPVTITVKLKIAAFFAYAIILPLLVIASLSTQYIGQSDAEMMNVLHKEAHHAMEKLDAHYEQFLKRRSRALAKYLTDTVEMSPEILLDKGRLKKFHDGIVSVANPGEVIITDVHKTDYLSGISRRVSRDRSPMCQAGSDVIRMIVSGNIANGADVPGLLSMMIFSEVYKSHNRISYIGVGEFEMEVFYRLLLPPDNDISRLRFVAAFWELHRLQREYVEEYCRSESSTAGNIQMAAYCRTSEELFQAPSTSKSRLIRLMNMSVNRKTSQSYQLTENGQSHIVLAMPGRRLNRLILAALLSMEPVLRQRAIILSRARVFAVFLCLLSMATMSLLRSWIFRPLEELKAGLEAIASRNFHKRINIVCQNEFGELMEAFNRSLETLQELEVARIVQESLLPETSLNHNQCRIIAQTRLMTNLGGDYYDMIPVDDRKVILFIGDATGHGIPAALSMAMAKAILIHENLHGLSDQKIMQQVNAVFGNLREQGSRDFMTAMCVELDTASGVGRLINAGHCFPMLMKMASGEIKVLSDVKGLPPGFDRDAQFNAVEFELEHGDSLIMFTDGFVEFQDGRGEQLGFPGLARLIAETSDPDLANHVAAIFAALEALSPVRQDDCTLVMVRRQ